MHFLIGALLVCAAWSVVASLLIAGALKKRGLPVNYFWLRLMIFRYLHQYRRITREETGRVGPLFYHYVVPLNVALALVVVIVFLGGKCGC